VFGRVGWLVDRFAVPLAVTAWTVQDQWGCPQGPVVPVVMFALFFERMILTAFERPICPILDGYPPYRQSLCRWQNYEVGAIVVLLYFEVVFDVLSTGRYAIALFVTFALIAVPYTRAVVLARREFLNARAMVAECREWLVDSETADSPA
jgi:hypothetical protein